ncbi:MAG: flippase-like domain-containing protein [Chlorobi bacterium]|nr:flippase-like domain-containing protein [Chlorobiota bacterium]
MSEQPVQQPYSTSKPLLWKVVAGGVIVAGVLLWIAKVLDLQRVWTTLQQVNYLLALTSIVPVLSSHVVRAIRWRTMLRAIGLPAISLWDLFSAVMVGYTANNIVPRSGELLRPYVLAKRHGISSATVLASVLAERMLDIFQLLLFLGAGLLFLPTVMRDVLPVWMFGSTIESLAIVLLILALVVVVVGITSLGERLVVGAIRWFNRAFAERISNVFESFRRGLRIMRNVRDVLRIWVESIAMWILYAVPLWIVLQSVPMSIPAGTYWSFADACIILVVVAVGTTVAPTPGAIGVVHALVSEAMNRLYGVPLEDAFVFITVAHGLNYLAVMVIGAYCTAREGVTLLNITRGLTPSETEPTAIGQTDA